MPVRFHTNRNKLCCLSVFQKYCMHAHIKSNKNNKLEEVKKRNKAISQNIGRHQLPDINARERSVRADDFLPWINLVLRLLYV